MNIIKQYPKMVMVIRHGEKPGDPDNDKNGGLHLSILGSARAAALPSLFTPDPNASPVNGLHQLAADLSISKKKVHFTGTYGSTIAEAGQSRFPTPDFLFATEPDKGSYRPLETVKPLAAALQSLGNPKLKIKHKKFTNDESGIDALISEIQGKGIYADKVILICWHHGKIPELVHALAPSSELPWSKWPANIFDLILCITWNDGQAKLVIENQNLLYDLADCGPLFNSGSITRVLDAPQESMKSTNGLPRNFRSMDDYKVSGNLVSGSAQYSPLQLETMISQKVKNHALTVIDLRQESHGFLTIEKAVHKEQEIAVSWFVERDWINVAKGFASIQADESQRLSTAAKSPNLTVYEIVTKTAHEDGICTATAFDVNPTGSYHSEGAWLIAHDIGYLRLPTTDHCRPRDSEVDRFVAFEANLAEGTWLYFHCRAGDGRTTTFMAMHDIIHNAPGDSLDVILTRQGPVNGGGIGGVDLTKVGKSQDRFDYPFLTERVEFIQNFYKYICQAKPGGFKLTWSDWVIMNTMQVWRIATPPE